MWKTANPKIDQKVPEILPGAHHSACSSLSMNCRENESELFFQSDKSPHTYSFLVSVYVICAVSWKAPVTGFMEVLVYLLLQKAERWS